MVGVVSPNQLSVLDGAIGGVETPRCLIACCLDDNSFEQQLADVIFQEGAIPLVTRSSDVLAPSHKAEYAAIIVSGPCCDGTVQQVTRRTHNRRPDIPILIYVPSYHLKARHVQPLGTPLPMTIVRVQADEKRHHDVVRQLIDWTTPAVLMRVLGPFLVDRPGCRALVAACAANVAAYRASVPDVAATMGCASRTLARRFQQGYLPTPKATLDLVSLAYVALAAARSCTSLARVAKALGIDRSRLSRMRARLSGEEKVPDAKELEEILTQSVARLLLRGPCPNISTVDLVRQVTAQAVQWLPGRL